MLDLRSNNISVFLLAGPWLEQRTPQGYLFYYNTATQQSSWAKPVDFTDNAGLLTKEEIQVSESQKCLKNVAKSTDSTKMASNTPQPIPLAAALGQTVVKNAIPKV